MDILNLCKRIGIETFGDLQRFTKEEKHEDESVLDCLKRYYEELKEYGYEF